MSAETARGGSSDRGFFGHPRGLGVLFFTEAWERFSYYGMRAILLYYMYSRVEDGGLAIDEGSAKSLIAAYGASIYMAAIAGGWISDRLLGARRCTLIGGILIMFGHICLALPAGVAALAASMIFIVLGTGLLKPNISTQVGDLYSEQDARRDAGFSIYYMGISVGAVVAPFAVGTLGQNYNYHLGFSLAAVGMAAGLIVYVLGRRSLDERGLKPSNPLEWRSIPRRRIVTVAAVIAAIVLVIGLLVAFGQLTPDRIVDLVTLLSIAIPIAYFVVMLRSDRTTAVERSRLRAYIPLFIAAVMFWTVQEQAATVVAQFADQRTDLDALGFTIPSSWFQSVGSFVLIISTPFIAALWMRLGKRQPSTPQKFSIGLCLAGLSFLLLVIPSLSDELASPLWLLGSLAIVTLGEIALSPVGMSATTRLAPAAFATQTMGLWLASDSAAQGITAQVVRFYDSESPALYFGIIGSIAIGLAILLLIFAPLLRKQMKGADVDSLESEKPDAPNAERAGSAGKTENDRSEDEGRH